MAVLAALGLPNGQKLTRFREYETCHEKPMDHAGKIGISTSEHGCNKIVEIIGGRSAKVQSTNDQESYDFVIPHDGSPAVAVRPLCRAQQLPVPKIRSIFDRVH